MSAATRKYPEGITRMADYVGCVVKLKQDFRGFAAERRFTVAGHYRGRLNLALPATSAGDVGNTFMTGVPQDAVQIVAWRLA